MSHLLCLDSNTGSNVVCVSLQGHRTARRDWEFISKNVSNMASVFGCKIAGAFMAHRRNTTATMTSLQPISSCGLFRAAASVCVRSRLRACVGVNVWQREEQARSVCNSVCEGSNTHLYDNFLFTMSKDSNTDTIHFLFIYWCRNVGPGRVTSEVFQGQRGGGVCYTGGRRQLVEQGGWVREPCIHTESTQEV